MSIVGGQGWSRGGWGGCCGGLQDAVEADRIVTSGCGFRGRGRVAIAGYRLGGMWRRMFVTLGSECREDRSGRRFVIDW